MTGLTNRSRTDRKCGTCSLCCTVLRVDELSKLGGVACQHQCEGGGCAIHERRPNICRSYTCLWLSGGLGDEDRPDRLGAIVDILTQGAETRLSIQEARPDAFDTSKRLQEIANQYRESMPVRIVEAGNFLDPDRPFRVLLAGAVEHRIEGEWTTVTRPGQSPVQRHLPWLSRRVRRMAIWFRERKVARMKDSHSGAE